MFNIHQMRIGRPKKHLLGTQAASTTRRTAAVSPPTEARGAAGSSSWGPGCQLGTWKPTKRGIFMDFHGFSWIVMDFHGFSLIFMDFTMDFTVNFTHKPWLKVGLLSEDFPHVPQKTHTHKKKKEPKLWCPQPNCAAVVEESSTAACSYIGGRSLAVSAADLLGWGNSLVASTQNTLDSQKLSDGKINLGLKIDKSKQPFETAKWREFQL